MKLNHFEMLPLRAFQTLGRRLLTLEGKGSAPATPDYVGAAQTTAAGNLDTARAAAAANRVNQYTPYGSLEYTHKGTGDDGWSATQTLSPAEQQKLTQTNALETGLLSTAQQGLGYVNQTLGAGGKLNESTLAQPGISGQTVQDAVMSRLQPQMEQNRESLRTRLANQGLMEGSEAYRAATQDQSQQENDLYTQAALQGINTGLTARQQGIQEQYTAQDRPLNIVNALRTGNQVQTPQFVNVPQQQTTAGADILGAVSQQYNAESNNVNAANAQSGQALGTVGSVAAAYFL